ncbi:MAG: hypothetical protein PVI57_03540, partial [Gemmatimonadota bacterium]
PARRTLGGIVRWWERRRLPYNLIVGSAGLVSTAYVSLLNVTVWGQPLALRGLLPLIVAFGVGANVCYALGPVVEAAVEKLSRGRVLPVGPALYRMGLTFSVGLALFPALLATLALVILTLAKLFGLAG